MKRIAAIVLALVVCLTFGAWKSPEAYTKYTEMVQKMSDVTSLQTDVSGSMYVQNDQGISEILIFGNVEELYGKPGDYRDYVMKMNLRLMVPGRDNETIYTTAYYKDGWMYQSVGNEKVKYLFNLEEIANSSTVGELDIVTTAIDNLYEKPVPVGYQLDFELDAAKMSAVVNDILESYVPDSQGVYAFYDYMDYSIVVDEYNNMRSYEMKFSANLGKLNTTVQYVMGGEITGVNTLTAINMPTDLDSYTNIGPEPEPEPVAAPTYTAPAATAPAAAADEAEVETEAEAETETEAEVETEVEAETEAEPETEAETEASADEDEMVGEIEA